MMKWQAYFMVLLYHVNGDCRLDLQKSSSNISDRNVSVQSTNEACKADACSSSMPRKDCEDDLQRGKRCLRNLDKCIEEDTTYNTSASHLIDYLTNTIPPFKLHDLEGVRQECQQSSQKFIRDLRNFKYWALQMYDATAKLPSGFLSGNVLQFGDFDLCMEANSAVNNIYGQYCLANIQIKIPNSDYLAGIHDLVHAHGLIRSKLTDPSHRVPRFSSIQWGLCVPHTCDSKDVTIGLHRVLGHIFNNTELQYEILVDSTLCTSAEPQSWPIATSMAIFFFFFILLLEVFATLCDIYRKNNNNEVILIFSLRNNLRKLFSTPKENDIDAVHTVRFVSGIMLMVAHKSMALLFLPYMNRTTAARSLGEAWTVIGRAASLYTDPFIMISGTLTAHSLIGKLREGKRINIIQEYISRILRILPTFVALIIFCTLILPWTDSGPLWKSVITHHSNICKQHWWKNILFIHNYFGFENMCLTHTHHVGIDTQLFFLSPFLVWLIWKRPKFGVISMVIIGAVSTWMRYNSTYTRNLANYVYYGATIKQLFLTADYMYIIPMYRLTVYVMGIILGYLLRQHRNIKIRPIYIYIGHIMAILSFGGAFIAPSFMGRFDYVYSPSHAAWYAAYAPILWCFSFGWFIYVTHIGYVGLMGPILRNFIPKLWTKISYTVYLTQFPVYFYNVGTTKHTDEYGVVRKHGESKFKQIVTQLLCPGFFNGQLFFKGWVNLLEFFWVIFFSLVLTLFIEIPSQNVRNYIFRETKSVDTRNNRHKKIE